MQLGNSLKGKTMKTANSVYSNSRKCSLFTIRCVKIVFLCMENGYIYFSSLKKFFYYKVFIIAKCSQCLYSVSCCEYWHRIQKTVLYRKEMRKIPENKSLPLKYSLYMYFNILVFHHLFNGTLNIKFTPHPSKYIYSFLS